jgi:hypothetical protein
MSSIPADLQRLWTERDRNQDRGIQPLTHESNDDTDDTSPLLFIRDEEFEERPSQQPLPVRSLIREVTLIPIEKIFPVYSLKPQTIHLGTHHGRPPGNP